MAFCRVLRVKGGYPDIGKGVVDMKKFASMMVLLMLLLLQATMALADVLMYTSPVYLRNQELTERAVIKGGTAYLAMTGFEELGASTVWSTANGGQAEISYLDRYEIIVPLTGDYATRRDTHAVDIAGAYDSYADMWRENISRCRPFIQDDSAYLPLRPVAEMLGYYMKDNSAASDRIELVQHSDIAYDDLDEANLPPHTYRSRITVRVMGEALPEQGWSLSGVSYLPMRVLFEKLGAQVDWNDSTQQVEISAEGLKLTLPLKGDHMTVQRPGGAATQINISGHKPFVAKGRIYLPVRLLAEKLGYRVDWGNGVDISPLN